MDEPIILDPPQSKSTVSDSDLKAFVVDMPEVVPDAVKAAEDKAAAVQTIQEISTDYKGRKFDPAAHLADEKTGEPLKTPTGRFRRKLNIPIGGRAAQAQAAASADPLLIEASQYADFFIMSYRGFAGDEANPEPGERESLIDGWHKFFLKYGTVPLNPIVGLLIFHVAYIGRRAAKPKTNTILKAAGEKVKGFMGWVWSKITRREVKK